MPLIVPADMAAVLKLEAWAVASAEANVQQRNRKDIITITLSKDDSTFARKSAYNSTQGDFIGIKYKYSKERQFFHPESRRYDINNAKRNPPTPFQHLH